MTNLSAKPNTCVACVQMVSSDDSLENFARAESLLSKVCREKQPDLVVFPENFLHFGVNPASVDQVQLNELIEQFCVLAQQYSTALVLGSVPVPAHDALSRFFSRSMLVNAQGIVQSTYDKQHLFDVNVGDEFGCYKESATFCPGDKLGVETLSLAERGNLNLGMSICYDLRFPEQYQEMRAKGADILLVPSAFTYKTGKAHWETLLRARAIETQCFVIAANQGGVHSEERRTWGHSMIVDPWGEILDQCGLGESYCNAVLDFDTMAKIRRDMPLRG
jgi:deaminated glutathione amidase